MHSRFRMFDLNKSKTIGYHLPMGNCASGESIEKNHTNDIASKALINEYKGNLFEYLVGHQLALGWGVEGAFLSSFGGEAKERLTFYQRQLHHLDQDLYRHLPHYARAVAESMNTYLSKQKIVNGPVHNIVIMGKSAAGGQDDSFGECDLMIVGEHHHLPVSLKFCKRGAYVNTKSGGLRSFIDKYFAAFADAKAMQRELNKELDISFERMAGELYQVRELDLNRDDKPFGPLWSGPHLPGQLGEVDKPILLAHYYRMIEVLFSCLHKFYQRDRQLFLQCLAPVIGLTQEQMVQVVCFYGDPTRDQVTEDVRFYRWDDFKRDSDSCELIHLKEGVSSFELKIGQRMLQIRVKPMNTFTVSAMKVNCGVRFL